MQNEEFAGAFLPHLGHSILPSALSISSFKFLISFKICLISTITEEVLTSSVSSFLILGKSLIDINGEVLSISQFTLYANCLKGRRPSFDQSENPVSAKAHYEYFNKQINNIYNIDVKEGIFGADMEIELINDGPVTIMLDSDEIIKK